MGKRQYVCIMAHNKLQMVHAKWDKWMQMADGAAELQEAVVRLCCLWWQKELPGRADMVPQMIPYLLYQATVSGILSAFASCNEPALYPCTFCASVISCASLPSAFQSSFALLCPSVPFPVPCLLPFCAFCHSVFPLSCYSLPPSAHFDHNQRHSMWPEMLVCSFQAEQQM